MTLPFAKTAPRLTMSQHATPFAYSSAFGSNTQRVRPGRVRSRANSLLGNGPTTYIVLPTTNGAPWWPALTPVLKLNSSLSWLTLPVVIWVSELKRVPSTVPAGVVHSAPAPAACAHATSGATRNAPSNRASESNRACDFPYRAPSAPPTGRARAPTATAGPLRCNWTRRKNSWIAIIKASLGGRDILPSGGVTGLDRRSMRVLGALQNDSPMPSSGAAVTSSNRHASLSRKGCGDGGAVTTVRRQRFSRSVSEWLVTLSTRRQRSNGHTRPAARPEIRKDPKMLARVAIALRVRQPASLALVQGDSVPFGQPVQCPPMDAQKLGREPLVPSRLLQHAVHVTGDDVPEARGRLGGRPALLGGVAKLGRQVFGNENLIRRQGDGAFDGVLQFAHVAWPVVADEQRHRFGRDPGDRLGVRGDVERQEVRGEKRDVLAPLS